jgi:ubiquinone/menaquinone biosynthesis C-methylase UbiE
MAAPPGNPAASAFGRLSELADYWLPLTLRVVSDLGVADELAGGSRSGTELADAVGADRRSLERGLRALVAYDVFAEPEPGVYALTPLSELLRSDHPQSARDTITLMPSHVEAWARAHDAFVNGERVFDSVHGKPHYDWIADHPEENERFNRWMQNITKRVLAAARTGYDWGGAGTIVDVGGGTGELLAAVLSDNPEVRGVLVDLPHVVAEAPPLLDDAGVADRVEVVGGSFFDELPAAAAGKDLYVLKAVLHNWPDQPSLEILRHVRAAARPDSRMLVIDAVVPDHDRPHPTKLVDLNMLVLLGSPERTEREFAELFAEAGFRLTRVVPASAASLIEAVPADA